MTRILQLTFGVSCFLCTATSALGLEGFHSAVGSTEILRESPEGSIQERFLETASEDEDNRENTEEEERKKRQEAKPPLVLKLLQEKLDTKQLSNHLGVYHVPSPVPFTVPEDQLYYSHLGATAPERQEPQLPMRQLEEQQQQQQQQPKQTPLKYQYIYKVKDPEGNDFGHTEARVGDRTWGRYFVQLPDGREKTVRYWADDSGFHAEVAYTGKSPSVHQ